MKRTILLSFTMLMIMIVSAQTLTQIGSWEYGPTEAVSVKDITGRVIDNVTAKKGLNTYTPQQSGIYFVISNNNKTIERAVIIK